MNDKPGRIASPPRNRRSASGPIGRCMPRLRIVFDGQPRRLGPGKIELLEAVGETGSIAAAGRRLGMSYRRARLLVDEVNKIFARPAVVASPAGQPGGGAVLTEFGHALVAAYRRIEERTAFAIREEMAPFENDLAEP